MATTEDTTLVMQLDDGSHRYHRWPRWAEGMAVTALRLQQTSRLHKVVRATVFIGQEPPRDLPLA